MLIFVYKAFVYVVGHNVPTLVTKGLVAPAMAVGRSRTAERRANLANNPDTSPTSAK
jgi:hypothetical protein